VFIVAGFFHPVAVSHFSHGGVSTTSKIQVGSKLIFIACQLNSWSITLSHSCKKSSAQSKAQTSKLTCSKLFWFIK